jgi:hypothetical protein
MAVATVSCLDWAMGLAWLGGNISTIGADELGGGERLIGGKTRLARVGGDLIDALIIQIM